MIPRNLSRALAGVAFVAGAAAATHPLAAQGVIGRLRDRARQAVAPTPARCDLSAKMLAHNVTPDIVTRYVRALQARESEMQQLARQNTPVGRYFAAQVTNDSLERRRLDLDGGVGPDYTRRLALQQRMARGDATAIPEMQALAQEMDRRVTVPTVSDWNSMNAANSHLDTVMVHAGGFESCDWTALVEFLPQTINAIAQNPSKTAADLPNAGTPGAIRADELEAIRAHRVELARLLKISYKSDAMIAEEARAKAQQDSTQGAMATWMACRQRVMGPAASPTMGANPDSMRVWGQQAQDAQKRGDQQAVMAIAMKMNAAMAPGMRSQATQMVQVNQQCGRQPGTDD